MYTDNGGHGTIDRVMRFTRLFDEITAARHEHGYATERVQRQSGSVCATAAYASAYNALLKSGICGHGTDAINSPITVPDLRKRGATRTVAANTLVCIGGDPMDSRAVFWPGGAEARLIAYYDCQFFGGDALPVRHFQTWPMKKGDLGRLEYIHALTLTCTSPSKIKGDETKCPVNGTNVFSNTALQRMLSQMRDARCVSALAGPGGGGAATAAEVAVCTCPLCEAPTGDSRHALSQIRALLGTPEKPISLSVKKEILAERLVSIRLAAGVVEVGEAQFKDTSDLEQQACTADVRAALAHRLCTNETARTRPERFTTHTYVDGVYQDHGQGGAGAAVDSAAPPATGRLFSARFLPTASVDNSS